MAYRTEKNGQDTDIVIDGWEKGVADSPELGLASIQGGNITSIPGEISVSFSTQSSTIPPVGVTGASFSAVAAADVVTVSSTAGYYPGMAIKLDTSSVTTAVRALLVGAGGGGGGTNAGSSRGGGGGGGAVQDNASVSVSVGSYPVVVGVGGTGAGTTAPEGNNGAASTFNSLSAAGGGGGGGSSIGSHSNGLSGASGGGGGGSSNGVGGSGGTATAGNAGGIGSGTNPSPYAGGGGGGAGTGGAGSGGGIGGAGGSGVSNSISGSAVTYGGGGGGGGSNSNGAGGSGGGGAGTVAGTANTGGGGGGSADGGSGIVVISYPTGTITATGGSIVLSGGNTIHTFTGGTTNFVVTALNPQPGNTYYVGTISGNTFKLYYDIGLTEVVNFLMDLTGTYDVPSFGVPVWSSYYQYYASSTSPATPFTFILDNPGNCWYLRENAATAAGGTIAANTLQYTGNTGHATSGTDADFGLVVWRNYLFVIIGRTVDYISIPSLLSSNGGTALSQNWVFGWKTDLTYTNYQHQAIAALDDSVYICNAGTLASLAQKSGQTFDPTNTATYSWTLSAVLLPSFDQAMSIAQLGDLILIGGILNYLYTWNRLDLQTNIPLVCADKGIYRIVSTNSNAYVFAGTRGRIYICNAVQIQLYQEIPDSFSGDPEPYYNWQDATYFRNKLYFTFTGTTNAGVALTNVGGIWALGMDAGQTQVSIPTAGSLYNINQLSYGTYGGECPVILQSQLANPAGYGIGGAWTNASATGVDVSSSAPYASFQTVIQTDIIPIGTYYTSATNRQIEYKLSRPLVAGESVRISWRGNLTSAFTPVWTSTTTGQVSDAKQVNFQKQQWAQLQIELSSTASTPSYVRLREVRIR